MAGETRQGVGWGYGLGHARVDLCGFMFGVVFHGVEDRFDSPSVEKQPSLQVPCFGELRHYPAHCPRQVRAGTMPLHRRQDRLPPDRHVKQRLCPLPFWNRSPCRALFACMPAPWPLQVFALWA